MKFDQDFFDRRTSETEKVPREIYSYGLLFVISLVLQEFKDLLEEEGRRFGIMIKYLDKIDRCFSEINLDTNREVSEKINYLVRPILLKEYKRLIRKKISRADGIIILARHLLKHIRSNTGSGTWKSQVDTIYSVFDKLFGNIANYNKNLRLVSLETYLPVLSGSGSIGKKPCSTLRFEERSMDGLLEPIKDSGVRISIESAGGLQEKIKELEW